MSAFTVVREFEKAVAEFAGAKHGVAVNTGTSAIFLSLMYVFSETDSQPGPEILPARTFVSVPMVVLQAGGEIEFQDYEWSGVYQIKPHPIWDGALRFKRGMYHGGLHCLSFHARKILNIGEGGMVLTDDDRAAEWLRSAAYCGRKPPHYLIEDVEMVGWNLYMNPEKAARGLHLMEYVGDGEEDQSVEYTDLRKARVFRELSFGHTLRAA